jgi:alpha-glucosidase (family GH31 glycosyl hydrolase)
MAGTTENIAVNENNIPTFIRGGAFIPMIKTIQNTKDYSVENFDLHYYFDADCKKSSGKLFNDDGLTPNNIENGKYEILKFESQIEKNVLNLNFKTEIGKNFTASNKVVNLIIHNCNAKKVIVNGVAIPFIKQDNRTEIIVNWTQNTLSDINIEL